MSVNKKRVLGYCPIGNGDSIAPFDAIFDGKKDVSSGFDGVDAVVFWGVMDIHPSLYKQPRSYFSQAVHHPTERDKFEYSAMKYCKLNNIPMIGVCRGAQLMCAFAGGTLIQHVTNHVGGNHLMTTSDGDIFYTTSCHHQMLYPWDVDHKMLAWSTESRSSTYMDGSEKEIDMSKKVEPEVVYFPRINGLAIQGHPEWAQRDSEFAHYCNQLINEYLFEIIEA